MTRPRAVVLDGFTADQGDSQEFWRGLRARADLTVYPRTSSEERLPRCQGAQALLTNKVAIDGALIADLPELRYIGVLATGTNVVDLPAARARGIAVTNVPAYAAESVAGLVFGVILHFYYDVAGHDADVKAGAWARQPDFSFFRKPLRELAGKTLVLIGTGHIGGAVARIGAAFGMTVVRAAVPGSATPGRTPLADALPRADVVSLHCPLTETTRGLVGPAFLSALAPGAILINTGRGALVDEPALQAALAAGRLGGAGLDVLGVEPPPADHPLLNPRATWAPRLVVTPHIGWGSVESRRRLDQAVAENFASFLDGGRLNRVV
ncbi:MAG TPA: D-2-hydroxyacid dehydrogenase [Polyangia bacterium]|jgi:glycerate dehydrogenase|nr:D-2-hydroxyacid dehydrogenase [Polyangia bacterium]